MHRNAKPRRLAERAACSRREEDRDEEEEEKEEEKEGESRGRGLLASDRDEECNRRPSELDRAIFLSWLRSNWMEAADWLAFGSEGPSDGFGRA